MELRFGHHLRCHHQELMCDAVAFCIYTCSFVTHHHIKTLMMESGMVPEMLHGTTDCVFTRLIFLEDFNAYRRGNLKSYIQIMITLEELYLLGYKAV
jgi:hypothetical protein